MNKIFNIGLARTGTTSLHNALQTLNFSSIHFPTNLDAFNNHIALCDTTITLGYKFLDVMFPNSKFILTMRNVESWLGSMEALFSQWDITDERTCKTDHLHYALYGTHKFNKDKMQKAFFKHLDDVTDYFKFRETDLLTIYVEENNKWDKLCEFLEVPIPEQDYPHAHRREDLNLPKIESILA